ncbi:MAG: nitroreductase/quinone reductase family protein [Micromonosporaceae bacterium]
MSERVYLRPPWFARVVGNRMAAFFRPSLVSHLSVQGRRSGRWHTVPVAVLDHGNERYLLAPRGETDWVLNLRASGTGRLTKHGLVEEITVAEVPKTERSGLVEAYLARYRKMPTVAPAFRALPDPADHPTFRITGSASPGPAAHRRGGTR